MPKNPVNQTVQRQLARLNLFLGGGERFVKNYDFLVRNRHGRRLEYSVTLQRTLGITNSAVREAELGLEVVVTVLVHPIGVRLHITAQTLLWLGVEDQTQRGEVVRTHSHHGAASEGVVEVDVVLAGYPPR